ncbi:hypothetical protein CFR80_04485 [Komagataeibacter oboediens]|uniref:Glycosyltransferase RgtA/B/C/D-like domain-containing protein n=2 Tax=Komagataeibacter oboediens TaxID=65958 RepID=A0A318QZX0_9PROT|nr:MULTISPECIES: hypothetical protein [Komagataeibacter]MBV1822609.1 hypothetical protein [Komagataeibacter oboediens]PYD82971.1 hypothetical protein CFR80_04485 [Komagataeibacter oboediens]
MKYLKKSCGINYIFILCMIMYLGDTLFWEHLPVKIKENCLSLTFNSMMDHMLHGSFDVDPETVGQEGFLRNGHVYAYWGIFPALLRLPVIFLPHGLHIDITRLSCAIAAILMFCINLRSISYITTRTASTASWVRSLLFVAVAFTGVQICFLCPSLYQEVCLWALVFGMMFVYWALHSCLDPEEAPKALIWMSAASVGALLTRVSMGIGTYGAETLLGLLVLWRCWRNTLGAPQATVRKWLYQCAVAIIILIVGILLAAGINFERWGNPLTFANYNLYLFNEQYPDRLIRTEHYGLFNIQRIPLGLIYFFFPLWFIRNGDHLFFQDAFTRLIDAAELPPSSFFLTDGVFLLLGWIFVSSLMKRALQPRSMMVRTSSLAIIVGLSVPAILMLMAISMNYRYRAEFYPLIIFMGFMGAHSISLNNGCDRKWLKPLCWGLVAIGILTSHVVLILYDVSELGPATRFLTNGVVSYYRSKFCI